MRSFLFCFLLGVILGGHARGQSLEDSVRQVAKNVLAAGEVAHVTEHPLAPEFAAETTRARTLLDRALRRPTPRDARTVEVVVTATENVSGPLLVLQIQRGDEQFVETAAYISQSAQRLSKPSLVADLLWRQPEPILDVSRVEDQMLVLSPARIVRLVRTDGHWETADSVAMDRTPPSRDPRGRLMISDDMVSAFLPAENCAGTWKPALKLACAQSSSEFAVEGEQLHFSLGENTLETATGEKLFSIAHSGDLRLAALPDGSVQAARGQQAITISDWGSDIASLPSRCGANPVLVSGSSLNETLTAYEVTGASPRRVSDPKPMQGAVTALWPSPQGALAVVHETATGQYAAYSVSLDCGN